MVWYINIYVSTEMIATQQLRKKQQRRRKISKIKIVDYFNYWLS